MLTGLLPHAPTALPQEPWLKLSQLEFCLPKVCNRFSEILFLLYWCSNQNDRELLRWPLCVLCPEKHGKPGEVGEEENGQSGWGAIGRDGGNWRKSKERESTYLLFMSHTRILPLDPPCAEAAWWVWTSVFFRLLLSSLVLLLPSVYGHSLPPADEDVRLRQHKPLSNIHIW